MTAPARLSSRSGPSDGGPPLSPEQRVRVQRRTVAVLSIATILGGLGVGAALSVGALLLAEVSGNDAISGLASATFSAGAAVAGIPLARLAARRGRRRALVTGSLVAMLGSVAAILGSVVGQPMPTAQGHCAGRLPSWFRCVTRYPASAMASARSSITASTVRRLR